MARDGIILRCTKCKEENYITKKNKRLHTEKLETKKHCSKCNSHQIHAEKK